MRQKGVVFRLSGAFILLAWSASAQEERDNYTWSARGVCEGANAPTVVDLTVFLYGIDSYGYLRLGWYQNNAAFKDDVYVVLDVMSPTQLQLKGSSITIADLKFNKGISGEIKGVVDSRMVATVLANDWECREATLEFQQARAWNASASEFYAALVNDARDGGREGEACKDSLMLQGPRLWEAEAQISSAASFKLCNPSDFQNISGIAALRATGMGDYRFEDDVCRAYLLGFPIADLTFRQKDLACSVDTTSGNANCSSRMQIDYAATTIGNDPIGASAKDALQVAMAQIPELIANVEFEFRAPTCDWKISKFSTEPNN